MPVLYQIGFHIFPGNGAGGRDDTGAVFLLQKIIGTFYNGNGSEIVDGKDQTQVFSGAGDAGTEDQAVQSLRAEAEKLVNGLLPPFGKRQICFISHASSLY